MGQLRALIIDDDRKFAAALARALGRYGVECEAVASVPSALKHLSQSTPDAMIVDVRLPEIGGLTFLRSLADAGVNLPTVLVSAYARTNDRREAHRLGVPLVEKPFRVTRLMTVLEEVVGKKIASVAPKAATAVIDPQERMRTALRRVTSDLALGRRDLPVLDPRVQKAQSLMRKEDPTLEEVLEIVGDDPTICASLLRAANVTVLSGEPIRVVSKAVVRLGAREAIDVIVNVLMRQAFDVRRGPYGALVERMWRCSLATGRLAHWLAGRTEELDAEEMRLAGLMHNAGELLLVCAAAELPARIRDAVPIGAVLNEVSILHEGVGEILLDGWQIPKPLPRWAGRHHGDDLPPGACALQLAWLLATEHGFSYQPREPDAPAPPSAALRRELERARVSLDDVLPLLETLNRELEGDGVTPSEEGPQAVAI